VCVEFLNISGFRATFKGEGSYRHDSPPERHRRPSRQESLTNPIDIVKYHDMNRAALIERIEEATTTLEKLLTLLKSAPPEPDRFVSHLYQSRREYRRTCETAGKSGKQIKRCVIPNFRIAQNMGFQGDFRQCAFAADWRLLSGAVRPPIERGIDL
jgi:hypothetical protein